jgi:hypothetical protein
VVSEGVRAAGPHGAQGRTIIETQGNAPDLAATVVAKLFSQHPQLGANHRRRAPSHARSPKVPQ